MSAPAKEAALTFISRFCRQPAKVSSRRFAIMRIQNSSPFSLFLFAMESIIAQLTQQEVWEEFLAYRLRKGRFNWHEFKEADAFVVKMAALLHDVDDYKINPQGGKVIEWLEKNGVDTHNIYRIVSITENIGYSKTGDKPSFSDSPME